MKTKLLTLFLLIAITFGGSPSVLACGPFVMDVVFSLKSHPDLPMDRYAAGAPGIVPTTYGPMSLVLFYRQLNGLTLTKAEQDQAKNAVENKVFYRGGAYEPHDANGVPTKVSASTDWLEARAKLTEEKREVTTEKSSGYFYYSNCLPDAFRTATKTLQDRVTKYGAEPAKEWLKGQDAVFAACDSETSAVPEDVSAPEWLKKDRAYQAAAILFYQGKMPEARTAFEAIAKDNGSPWKNTSAFLVSRTYIREASLLPTDENGTITPESEVKNKEFLGLAIKSLEGVVKDSSKSEFHASASRLIGLTKFRMIPGERRKELGTILTKGGENRNFYNDLTDYGLIVNRLTSDAADAGRSIDQKEAEAAGKQYNYDYSLKLRDVPASERQDDLTDWIISYQAVDGTAHAIEKWKAAKSLPWFVAAISKVDGKSSDATSLLSEADKVDRSSPAFATVRFHQVRMLIEAGRVADAKKKFDEIGDLNSMPVSTQNSFLAQRTVFASNLDEYLKYAQRKPAIFTWNETDREEPAEIEGESKLRAWTSRAMFDADAALFFNEKVPLSVLKQAAESPQVPEHLKKMLVTATWTRAFVLKNAAVEKEFAPLVTRYNKAESPQFEKYNAAVSPIDREAAAFIAILRYPAIQPYVAVGYGREDSLPQEIDSIRGNWWCVENHSEKSGIVFPTFLTAAQTNEAKREKDQMIAGGDSATLLTRRALEFAAKNPRHSQTPEILHLAVRSTRYGCKDENTGKFSKQAFDLLHRQYTTSPWTKQTPYWFGQQ